MKSRVSCTLPRVQTEHELAVWLENDAPSLKYAPLESVTELP